MGSTEKLKINFWLCKSCAGDPTQNDSERAQLDKKHEAEAVSKLREFPHLALADGHRAAGLAHQWKSQKRVTKPIVEFILSPSNNE